MGILVWCKRHNMAVAHFTPDELDAQLETIHEGNCPCEFCHPSTEDFSGL